ncbi:hypothetical protein Tsubulata_037000 [Turnera subulata]|uniref:Uncharacterized protein n=1 Tax=Turnera subulata TaxID=218843 RepID=A0A9Q0FHJ1_9ROSI|nr:hypothetical protein Tsubulata_037000 [Turnera subulata]
MQRSTSSTRVVDELFKNNNTTTTTTAAAAANAAAAADSDNNHLPTYDPLSHVARKERSRLRSAENAIHLIPLVLVLCAIILWFFSNPEVLTLAIASYLKVGVLPIALSGLVLAIARNAPRRSPLLQQTHSCSLSLQMVNQ